MNTYKPKKLILPEHLVQAGKVAEIWNNRIDLYADEEYVYQYIKVIYKMLHNRKRKREMDGEIK